MKLFLVTFLLLFSHSTKAEVFLKTFKKRLAEQKVSKLKKNGIKAEVYETEKEMNVYYLRTRKPVRPDIARGIRKKFINARFKKVLLQTKGNRSHIRAGDFYNPTALKRALRKAKRLSSVKFKGYKRKKKFPYYVVKTSDDPFKLVYGAAKDFLETAIDNAEVKASIDLNNFNQWDDSLNSHPYALLHWQKEFGDSMSIKGGLRLDLIYQPESDRELKQIYDLGESFFRIEESHLVSTTGFQLIRWSRFDEFSLLDQLTRPDFERFLIADIDRRQRTQLAQRFEYFIEDAKLDLVLLPQPGFLHLPDSDSRWSPISKSRGRVLGVESSETLQSLLSEATIDLKQKKPDPGMALRWTDIGENWDYGLTYIKAPSTTPSFNLNDNVRGLLALGSTPEQAVRLAGPSTFTLERPEIKTSGVDFVYVWGDYTIRFESIYQSGRLSIDKTFGQVDVDSHQASLGVEIFPGDGELRLDLRASSSKYITSKDLLVEKEAYYTNGLLEYTLRDWKLQLGYNLGLTLNDVVLNPELHYLGRDNEIYKLRGYHFSGDDHSVGGYYKPNSYIGLEAIFNI